VEEDVPEGMLSLAEVEKRHILRVLEAVKGNRTAAAKALQIGRNTLGRKLKEYGLGDEG
jgi:Nif-specific regulatory protein